MKLKTIVLLAFAVGLMLPVVVGFQRTQSGDAIYSYVLNTQQVPWKSLGSITASLTSPAVGARDYSAVWGTYVHDTNSVEWSVPNDASGVEFRFMTTTNADAHVVEIWIAASDTMADGTEESFQLGAILTLTGGQQVGAGGSGVFVDTISAVEYTLTNSETLDSAADRVAVWKVDLRGYKRVVVIATTLAGGKTITAHARWY